MNEKQKLVVGCVIMVAAISGLGALHFFKLKERSKLQDQIEKYGRQAVAAREKIGRIESLRRDREELISFIDEYTKILPKEEHTKHDAFVNIIDNYRRDTRLDIRGAEYVVIKDKRGRKKKTPGDEPEKQKDFLRHRYKFKLEGTVQDLIEFVNKIENHERFLKVDALIIRPLGSAGDNNGRSESQELEMLTAASNPRKDIELTISTYTYYKGAEKTS